MLLTRLPLNTPLKKAGDDCITGRFNFGWRVAPMNIQAPSFNPVLNGCFVLNYTIF